jgi:hypothetical protein
MTDAAFAPDITLTRALAESSLLGATFSAHSFWTWKVVAKLIDGLPLTEPREIELFKQCSGRSQLLNRHERRRLRRFLLLVGRRGGKDRFLSAVAVWRAALCALTGDGTAVLVSRQWCSCSDATRNRRPSCAATAAVFCRRPHWRAKCCAKPAMSSNSETVPRSKSPATTHHWSEGEAPLP